MDNDMNENVPYQADEETDDNMNNNWKDNATGPKEQSKRALQVSAYKVCTNIILVDHLSANLKSRTICRK
jgi:hypothetical protein